MEGEWQREGMENGRKREGNMPKGMGDTKRDVQNGEGREED